jgi:hypothetical protein
VVIRKIIKDYFQNARLAEWRLAPEGVKYEKADVIHIYLPIGNSGAMLLRNY